MDKVPDFVDQFAVVDFLSYLFQIAETSWDSG